MGEAYVAQLASVADADIEWTFANIVSRWASSGPVDVEINGIGDLVANVDQFVNETLASAVVHATARLESAGLQPPAGAGDLTFRVAASLRVAASAVGQDQTRGGHAQGDRPDERAAAERW